MDSTIFNSKHRKETIKKNEILLAALNDLENKNGGEASDWLEEINMASEFMNPIKPISISQEELLKSDKKVIQLSDLSTEIDVVSLEKAIRSRNCFLIDVSGGQSEK